MMNMPLQNATKVTEFIISGFEKTKRPLVVGVVILIVFLLTVLANLLNILFIVFDKRLHKPMYFLICNLSVVDILYTSSASPTMIGVLLAGKNTISYVSCFVQMYIHHTSVVMEMFALAVMAFDRLIAIKYPFQYTTYLANMHTFVIVSMLWVSSCTIATVMPVTLLPLYQCNQKLRYTFCEYPAVVRTTCSDHNYYFNLVTIIASFLIFFTFGFICVSYLAMIFYVQLSSKEEKRKFGSTCVSHLIVVTCYYCPVFIYVVVTRLGLVLTLEEKHGLTIGAILGPSLVNPFVYCLRTKEIRHKIFRTFKKVKTFE